MNRSDGQSKGEIACYDLDLYVPLAPPDQQSAACLDSIVPDPLIDHVRAFISFAGLSCIWKMGKVRDSSYASVSFVPFKKSFDIHYQT